MSWRTSSKLRRRPPITSKEAETVFLDDNALLLDDPDHSWDEKRFVLLGLSSSLRVLLVCHCFLDEDTVRLISARRASKQERRQYAERFEE